ncbi:G5 domain-containing protein [Paractinoplanes toevensis]|nr:G5 domain-containing protein [Actinoplanes toevensis]
MNQTPVWMPPQKRGFWSRLTPVQRVGLIAAALILPCCGGLTAIGALTDSPKPVATDLPATEQLAAEPSATPGDALAGGLSATPGDPPDDAPAGGLSATPGDTPDDPPTTEAATTAATTTKTVKVTKAVGFSTKTVKDDNLEEGKTRVRTKGVPGVRTLTYRVVVSGGKEASRKLVSDVVTRKPVTKVVAIGTKTAGDGCDPNYDPCVPVASDVDCAGGSGNGPAYVDGPITVIGDDVYDLDRDGDGVACDS